MNLVDNEDLRPRIYTAYGQTDTSSLHSNAAYAGEIVESGANGYLLGQRPYAPALRRFLAPDTESPFGPGGWNRYAYCAGDPVSRVDPEGTFWHALISLFISLSSSVRSAKNAYKTVQGHLDARSYTSLDGLISMAQQKAATLFTTPTGVAIFTAGALTAASASSTVVSAVHLLRLDMDSATSWATAGAALGFMANPPLPKPLRSWVARKFRIDVERSPDTLPKLTRYIPQNDPFPRRNSGIDPNHGPQTSVINMGDTLSEVSRRATSPGPEITDHGLHSFMPSQNPGPPHSNAIDQSLETPWYRRYFNAVSRPIMDALGLYRRPQEDLV